MQSTPPVRIAMWSGPRNISTAMMRSFGSRADTAVIDEPLYGHFLSRMSEEGRARHPCANDTINAMETDWRRVVGALGGPVPGGRPVWYQKHMAHHLTPGMDLGWVHGLTNCFLIRDPAAMIASYSRVIPDPTPTDLGLEQQVALFELVRERTGRIPPVIASEDVLADPRGVLHRLCDRIGIGFDEVMLSWAPGPRAEDGVWAPYWYESVERSTGFGPPREETPVVSERLLGTLEACRALHAALEPHRLV